MRPLILTMRCFGPFAGEQQVDFTRYGDNAFLLIHGVTGAGKTTILDGICYALYGDASGEKREDHYLRSQLARPEAQCEVEFLFQVGPRRFQIKRIPPQTIILKGKERKLAHQVEFCQVDDQGTICAERLTKVGEVQKKVEEVLGFTSSQFRQVVVLPQGEFRKLLLAKSDEKEHILEKLFGTERYKQVEEILKRRRASIGSELKELKAAVEGILSSNGAVTPQELEERISAIAAECSCLTVAIAEQESQRTLAQQHLQAARSLAERFNEQEHALKGHAVLEQQKPEMEQTAGRVERARKALGLADLLDAFQRAERELFVQRDQLHQVEAGISALENSRTAAAGRAERARKQSETVPALAVEQATLSTRLEKIRELAIGRSAVAVAQKAEKEASAVLEKYKKALASGEAQLAVLTERIESLSLCSGSAGQFAAELEKTAALLKAGNSLVLETAERHKLQQQIAAGETALQAATRHQLQAEQECNDLQQRFIKGQAALLAVGLGDGLPCPVCGSPDHPYPAETAEHVPSEKELDKFRKAAAEALKQQQKAEKELTQLLTRRSVLAAGIAALQESLGADAGTPPEVLLARKVELEQRQSAAQAAIAELTTAREERERLAATLAAARQGLAAAEPKLAAAAGEHEKLKAVAERLEKETAGEQQPAVEARLKEIVRSIEAARSELLQAEAELKISDDQLAGLKGQRDEKKSAIPRLEAELQRLSDGFSARLAAEGFKDRKECQAAQLSPGEIENLQQKVEHFRDALNAAAERLQRAAQACRGVERPDLAAVTAVCEGIDRQLANLRREEGVLQGQQQGVADALKSIGKKVSRITVLEGEYALTGRLADVTGGQNPKRMTLQRYVLAALFEEVAMAASQRLSRMSRGRYHLVRSETLRDNRAASGLDLDVTDDNTGEKRPAFTLSGGESFLASLSLALGLSDVVIAQCGGRYLDCIFIDEGFGSLDGETLDFALNTLIELHRSGRVIGIISHVAELRERIPSRIEVLGSREGSRIVQQSA